ncbi:protoheme IX farnesyltransferase [bacterium]|nr:protoheme IX farnesyltransferase [bacterium]
MTDPRAASTIGQRVRAWVALTKPRIIELLLVTTVPAMVIAADAWPDTWLVVATLIGGTLSAGGANAINNVVDRDIDSKMRRTMHRPLPAHRVGAGEALAVGLVLGMAGFVWLAAFVNLLSAILSTAALVFYVLVYTLWLKRSTSQNIVIGGAAGAVPVLVGWAAVTDGLDLGAWVLFAIVFYWTPPHFWALSLRFKEDYERAGVPMLPVVAGVENTTRQIISYTLLLVGLSLALAAVADLGVIYLVTAVGLGAWFTFETVRLGADPGRAMIVFQASNVYLTLLFAAATVDTLVL